MKTVKSYTKGLKLIGTGLFSKVYDKGDNNVLIVSIDPIKECMAQGWFPYSSLFPKIKFIEFLESGEDIYEMKKYTHVRSLKNNLDLDQWELYKTLKNIPHFTGENIHDGYSFFYKEFEKLPETLKDVMIEALDACSNYGSDICFEISPRNVKVENGKLILLDCFFMMSKARKVRTEKSGRKVW